MGCSSSKLDDEEAVQLCKDRKNFIKKAVEQRTKFASGHKAYLQSLKRVSAALKDYIEGDEPREFSLNSFTTPTLPTAKKTAPRFITISPNSFTVDQPKVNYLKSGGNPSVFVEERPPESPEIARVESYNNNNYNYNYNYNDSPVYQYANDSFFGMQNRPNLPPPSPQRSSSSNWDFFWNPFSSLDYYGYPARNSNHQTMFDDDINGLQQVREEEGIPELEEETEHEFEPEINQNHNHNRNQNQNQRMNMRPNDHKDEVTIEDIDDDDDDEFETDSGEEESESEHEHEPESSSHFDPRKSQNLEVLKAESSGKMANNGKGDLGIKKEKCKTEGTPGFTVYVNRRPTSMSEVIKDLEAQFTVITDSAKELSVMLEANRAQYSSTSHELTAMKILNPVALLRSASSSRSNSSRFLVKDDGYESSSDLSDDSCLFQNTHQSTLDKLYAWEKKLYQEVKAGEKIRIAYDKKCGQLRNHDAKGDDHSSVDKTRNAIRDLHTQIKVSIHSVEAVSKRIETLRDQELQPQLLELIQGLSRMWKVMAECHQTQKRTLDEAKMLLAGTPSNPKKYTPVHPTEPHRLARSATNLEFELQNWKSCFESWVNSQKLYIHAITGWLLRCTGSKSNSNNTTKYPFSPRRSNGGPPVFGVCIQWARLLDSVSEVPVLDGLDFFASGVGSLYVQQLREGGGGGGGSRRYSGGSGMEVVEMGRQEEEETAEKMAEVAIRVLCAGMSVAVSSLTEFALCSAQGYADLIKQWQSATCQESSSGPKV